MKSREVGFCQSFGVRPLKDQLDQRGDVAAAAAALGGRGAADDGGAGGGGWWRRRRRIVEGGGGRAVCLLRMCVEMGVGAGAGGGGGGGGGGEGGRGREGGEVLRAAGEAGAVTSVVFW